jgi:hypothetical protein
MKKKIMSLIILFALCTTLAPQPTLTVSAANYVTKYADKVPAVALGDPYCVTLSIQDNELVLSGFAPNYVADSSLQLDIIKPVNYGSCTIASDGRAVVGKDVSKAIKLVLTEIGSLDSISGYDKLWEYDGIDTIKNAKSVKNYVTALLERNPDLNRSGTTTFLYALHNLGINMSSTTSIVQGLLDEYERLDITYNIMDIMLSAAPKAATTVKTIKHQLTCTNDMAPLITVIDPVSKKELLTLDLPNVPKLNLSGIPDGVYNIRVGLTTAPLDKIYHDDILIVIKGGKASLQILDSTYNQYEEEYTTYAGYTLSHYLVQPAITAADYDNWQRGLPYDFEK